MKHKIVRISPESIGEALALEAGDFLLQIDGQEIGDVFDYRMAAASEALILLVEKGAHSNEAGELWELEIEKEIDEDPGLEFETPLMDEIRRCRNKCIFCFIDQQPQGLRDSLYVKDDDVRLSFLHGNYVTLTNIDEAEIDRIARYHLSPLRISVHAMDGDLRCRMMGNKHAGRLGNALTRFKAAGIEMHFQAVLCKGYNDGEILDETIEKLLALRPNAASLAIVPAGLTRHREGLTKIEAFTPEDARDVITQVEVWQTLCHEKHGTRFVYAADEWYVLAGLPLPTFEAYEEFLQLENGVGMCALFKREFLEEMQKPTAYDLSSVGQRIGVATGVAAYGFMSNLMHEFAAQNKAFLTQIFCIKNTALGEAVTVSGLLMGKDIISQMQSKCNELDILFLPGNAFRAGEEVMLDGVTKQDLEDALGVRVCIGSADGGAFYIQLLNAHCI
ncbi:MAG: DUF512 domain-containing protein [Defluviitaleaceae bacterium]|nr:DUF512 domain-containing protein [Defluviitaleaceae bacterium]MCL2274862.1 DUF512 domain-containing protein [Defluviitaleaceae bacterium]